MNRTFQNLWKLGPLWNLFFNPWKYFEVIDTNVMRSGESSIIRKLNFCIVGWFLLHCDWSIVVCVWWDRCWSISDWIWVNELWQTLMVRVLQIRSYDVTRKKIKPSPFCLTSPEWRQTFYFFSQTRSMLSNVERSSIQTQDKFQVSQRELEALKIKVRFFPILFLFLFPFYFLLLLHHHPLSISSSPSSILLPFTSSSPSPPLYLQYESLQEEKAEREEDLKDRVRVLESRMSEVDMNSDDRLDAVQKQVSRHRLCVPLRINFLSHMWVVRGWRFLYACQLSFAASERSLRGLKMPAAKRTNASHARTCW